MCVSFHGQYNLNGVATYPNNDTNRHVNIYVHTQTNTHTFTADKNPGSYTMYDMIWYDTHTHTHTHTHSSTAPTLPSSANASSADTSGAKGL